MDWLTLIGMADNLDDLRTVVSQAMEHHGYAGMPILHLGAEYYERLLTWKLQGGPQHDIVGAALKRARYLGAAAL